jgi:hypothetical protein
VKEAIVLDLDHDNYFRMHRDVWRMRLRPLAFMVYARLKDAGNRNGSSDPNRPEGNRSAMIADVGVKRQYFDDAVKQLEDRGMVQREYGVGYAVRYLLLAPSSWDLKSAGPKKGRAAGPKKGRAEQVPKRDVLEVPKRDVLEVPKRDVLEVPKRDVLEVPKRDVLHTLTREKEERREREEGIHLAKCALAPSAEPTPGTTDHPLFEEFGTGNPGNREPAEEEESSQDIEEPVAPEKPSDEAESERAIQTPSTAASSPALPKTQTRPRTTASKPKSGLPAPSSQQGSVGGLPMAKTPTLGSLVWKAYAETFYEVHGVPPTLNVADADEVKAVRAMCAKIAKKIGDDAPEVAAFYVRHKDRFLVQEAHPLEMLVTKAKRMHKELRTGTAVTATTARKIEQVDEQDAVGRRVLAEVLAERGETL